MRAASLSQCPGTAWGYLLLSLSLYKHLPLSLVLGWVLGWNTELSKAWTPLKEHPEMVSTKLEIGKKTKEGHSVSQGARGGPPGSGGTEWGFAG